MVVTGAEVGIRPAEDAVMFALLASALVVMLVRVEMWPAGMTMRF